MNLFAEAEVYQACRMLFGAEMRLNRDFLRYLQPKGAKQAYRQRAKETHPDRFPADTPGHHRKRVQSFQDLKKAYDLILDFLNHRSTVTLPLREQSPSPVRRHGATPRYQQGPTQSTTGAKDTYRGPMPNRPLEFGLYVYYRGLVPFRTLISALAWQRRQRPNLGEIALRWGWMKQGDIDAICRYRPYGGHYKRFGERAIDLNLLNQRQLQTLLYYQRTQQRRLGEYFIEQGLLTSAQLQHLHQEQQAHNRQFSAPGHRPF